jgi:hypothetical protein
MDLVQHLHGAAVLLLEGVLGGLAVFHDHRRLPLILHDFVRGIEHMLLGEGFNLHGVILGELASAVVDAQNWRL